MEGKLLVQETNIAKFVTLCEGVLNQIEPNISKSYIEGKAKLISELWCKIDTTNDLLIESIATKEQAAIDYFVKKHYEAAYQMYDKVTVKILAKLEKFEKPPQAKDQTSTLTKVVLASKPGTIKLKPIDIPTFSGDYRKWISFRNMFDSLVHNDGELTNLQKRHYLNSCLGGEAERIISQFDISEESYGAAYKAVTDRFHNEVILVDTHIISILSQPNLTIEASDSIKELMDVTTENLRALESLKVDTTTWDPILLLLLVQKLDPVTRRLWEQTLKPKVRATINEFMEFLSVRFHALGCQQKFTFSIGPAGDQQSRNKSQFNTTSNYKASNNNYIPRTHQNFHNTATPSYNQRKCPFRCGESHIAIECGVFRRAPIGSRHDLVVCANLCHNCLKGHGGKCALPPGCHKCGQNHHAFLHIEQTNPTQGSQNVKTVTTSSQPQTSLQTHHSQQIATQMSVQVVSQGESEVIAWDEPVLLATAIVLIRSQRDEKFYPFRALLDQASEASYISEYATQFLGLKKFNVVASTSGLGGTKTGDIRAVANFEISSKRNPAFKFDVQAPVVHKVSNPIPSIRLHKHDWEQFRDLPLADPQFYAPAKIDCLLGAAVYGYLLLPGIRNTSPQVPVAQNTEFGWILSGATRTLDTPVRNISNFHLRINLEEQLKKFFDQEEITKERILTKEEAECERIFKETHSRTEDGRFIVALPFKSNPKALGSSKGQAIARLKKLETKFKSNSVLKEEYTKILDEYNNLGHATKIGRLDRQKELEGYYLPHHAVFKPESTTTKTRVVFDASTKGTNGISLNDVLMTGPTLQDELCSILMRWRSYEIAFAADISKMYRQIEVRKEDGKYQKFVFREEVLAKGKFELRKFISNSSELLESIPEGDRELKLPLEINVDCIKTLGILYDPPTDTFQFKVNLKPTTREPTKRSLLSDTSRLFDPLGWLAPITIRAKILFQGLWQEGLSWDQKLPEHIAKVWTEFSKDLHNVEKIRMNRWFRKNKQTKRFELHGFCDAAKPAYAAVVYARVVDETDLIQITLLTAKTRVAPIKPITLNRLELCGAVLLANLMDKVQGALSVEKENVHYWTDSTVVLGWLRTTPAKLKVFVANRVVEIQGFSAVSQWHHIAGDDNPADCASRGMSPSELKDFNLWRERWRLQENIQRNFWKSWSQEYLSRLQQRPKWLTQMKNLRKGDMVLSMEDNMPALKWPIARVVEVYPGHDFNVRIVKIKTAGGEYDRPITKLSLLPINSYEEAEEAVIP